MHGLGFPAKKKHLDQHGLLDGRLPIHRQPKQKLKQHWDKKNYKKAKPRDESLRAITAIGCTTIVHCKRSFGMRAGYYHGSIFHIRHLLG